jgi:hypothetical protein
VEAFGGTLAVLPEPRHGKRWNVAHDATGLFADIPSPCAVGAYHSLYADMATFPHAALDITAKTEAGIVMAVRQDAADRRRAVPSRIDPVDGLGGARRDRANSGRKRARGTCGQAARQGGLTQRRCARPHGPRNNAKPCRTRASRRLRRLRERASAIERARTSLYGFGKPTPRHSRDGTRKT